MQCISCGAELLAGTAVCPRCARPLAYTSDADEIAYVDYGSAMQEAEAAPPLSQASDTPQKNQFSAGAAQERSSPRDGLPTDETEQLSPASRQAPLAPVAAPAARRTRSFSAVTIILLIILVILLLVGGSGLIYFATLIHPGELNIQATAVARTVLTNEIQSTVEADAHATAIVNALTPQQIYTKATSGIPVINDPLTGPDGSIWPHYDAAHTSCTFLGGAYHIKVSVKAGNNTCFAFNSFFNNLAYQVRMTIIKGDAGGLLFHIDQGFYLFLVNRNGSYSLFAGIGVLALLVSGKSPLINTSLKRSNLLSIVAFDGHIYLYINKQPLARASDSTFSSGQIGLFAGSATDLTDVAFNDVQVWSI